MAREHVSTPQRRGRFPEEVNTALLNFLYDATEVAAAIIALVRIAGISGFLVFRGPSTARTPEGVAIPAQ